MSDFCRDLSDIAKGGDRAKSEAATHNSPGLYRWVKWLVKGVLPVRGSCGNAGTKEGKCHPMPGGWSG
jgi:hypothetical protein